MDRKYILENNLMELYNRFMRLSEGYFSGAISEAGQDDETPPDGQGMPPMGNNMGAQDGGMPDGGMNEPQGMTQGDGTEGGQQGADAMGGDVPPMDGDVPPMDGDMPAMDDELEPQEDDDVIDVDDLTQAQEKLNKKQNEIGHDLGDVDDRIIALLTAVEKIQGAIEKNNSDITDLKSELEKRMPTKTEKLNMQSLKMYPFNVSPKEYWNDKEKDGVYQAEYDSQEPEVKKQYKITQDDVDDYSDREIEDSFDDNEKLRQTMKDIFKGF